MANWAIIIGINHYQFQKKLRNAVADAKLIRRTLVRDYGYSKTRISCLFDKQATRSKILRLIHDVVPRRWRVQPSDQLLVFFAGHGGKAGKKRRKGWFLVPSDGRRISEDPANIETVMSRRDIRNLESTFRGAHIFYVFDCCYAGMAFSYEASARPVGARLSVHALVAGRGGETVSDGGGIGHSVFTQSLVEALNGWGGFGSGADNSFTASDLIAFVRRDVPDQIAKKKLKPVQKPFGGPLRGNTDGKEFEFRPVSPRLSSPLVSLLLHQHVEARRQGVRQLGELSDPDLIDVMALAFSRMATDPSPSVREEVAFQVCSSLGSRAPGQVLQMLTDSDEHVLVAVLKVLPEIKGISSRAIPLVRKLQSSRNGRVRRAALACLALFGVKDALDVVVKELPTEQGSIRREIISILKKLGPTEFTKGTLTQVVSRLLKDDDWRARRAAAEALGELGLQGATGDLLKLAASMTQHYMVRYAAVEALGHIGQASAREVTFRVLIYDRSLLVRTAAAEAVAGMGGQNAAEVLIKAISRDEEWRVRRAAAESCGLLRDSTATDSLIRAADDPHFRVRMAVADALGEIGELKAKSRLELLAHKDPSRFVNKTAERALERLAWDQR